MEKILKINSVAMLHDILNISPPKHPLITLVDFSYVDLKKISTLNNVRLSSSFYSITLKKLAKGSLKYGRNKLDFQEGSLFFASPHQIVSAEAPDFDKSTYNWTLCFHPDLIHGTALSSTINEYYFWKYNANEALHLSEDEKQSLSLIVDSIKSEINRPIDKHTKKVLVSGIELLLNHCNRYYGRQFITREKYNKVVIDGINNFLSGYFNSSKLTKLGLPTVLQCAEHVNLSPNYLSDLLRKETGKTTQEHIHYHLLEIAKDRLLGTDISIKEIAFSLGFDYPHYFTRLFKSKVGCTPIEYRNLT